MTDPLGKAKAVLLLGPTGAGKTPLGDCLQAWGLWGRRCRHFDFGAALRRLAETPNADGLLTAEEMRVVAESLRTAALLEDEHFPIARKVLSAFVAETAAADLIVLNGLPRHVGQVRDVEAIVDVRAVVHLACAPEAAIARIRANTAGDRAERTDDDERAIRAKLDVFARRSLPLLEHYRRRGARIEAVQVDADARRENIWKQLDVRPKL